MNSCKMESMIRGMKAEKEMCLQDIITFKKMGEAREARKSKLWYIPASY
jgi:hypothetical protein